MKEDPLETKELETLESVAERIFGSKANPACRRWVEYWRESRLRNRQLLSDFEAATLLELSGRKVLDIGCGTGGLGGLMEDRGAVYFGADLHHHVLQFAIPGKHSSYLQCSGLRLPFPDGSFDVITSFDVIEHLVGGRPWQRRFLRELARVLSPLGMVLLTTPNFWYPYDAHTELYAPQFLPVSLADWYASRCNPGFLDEHQSFRNIRLLRPGVLRALIHDAGLAPLHELPCGLDRSDYRRLHPWQGWLTHLGLGWHLHAEFWTILVHADEREELRRKLRKNWKYEPMEEREASVQAFGPRIDFSSGPFSHQLGPGWYWHESHNQGCRWTGPQATCYLEVREPVRYLRVTGYSPWANRLDFYVDGVRVGEKCVAEKEAFEAEYLIPFPDTRRRMFDVILSSSKTVIPSASDDRRKLGVMIFEIELIP